MRMGHGSPKPSPRTENCGFALPVAEEAKPEFPQRSKIPRISASPTGFSGTARWTCGAKRRMRSLLSEDAEETSLRSGTSSTASGPPSPCGGKAKLLSSELRMIPQPQQEAAGVRLWLFYG